MQYYDCPKCNGDWCEEYYQYCTDGCCIGNHHRDENDREAGMGIYWTENGGTGDGRGYIYKQNLESCNIQDPFTNNTTELQAIRIVVKTVAERGEPISIHTDSEICLRWICGHNYVNKPSHENLVEQIRRAIDDYYPEVTFY